MFGEMSDQSFVLPMNNSPMHSGAQGKSDLRVQRSERRSERCHCHQQLVQTLVCQSPPTSAPAILSLDWGEGTSGRVWYQCILRSPATSQSVLGVFSSSWMLVPVHTCRPVTPLLLPVGCCSYDPTPLGFRSITEMPPAMCNLTITAPGSLYVFSRISLMSSPRSLSSK